MKLKVTFMLALLASFICGFGIRGIWSVHQSAAPTGKVKGIGGIFFKCKDPRQLRAWYEKNLGMFTNEYGAVFEWRQATDGKLKGFTQWSPFNEKTRYFAPSAKEFMINYRVDNIEALLTTLRRNEVQILDSVETFDYGKFVHILDLEGNKIELWEPNDEVYDKMGKDMGYPTVK